MTCSAAPPEAPLVTIYVPTRGRPELVERAVKSALAQDYSNLEVIVAIDGPDDESEARLEKIRAGDDRLRIVLRAESGGACAARNSAISEARGEWITGLDDDDELRPEHVSELVEAFDPQRHSFVCTTSVLRRKTGDLVRHAFEGPVPLGALLEQNVVGNQVLTETTRMRAVGGFDPTFPAWQDYELWVRLVAEYGPAYKIDARTYLVRVDHDAVRVTDSRRIHQAFSLFIGKHASLLSNKHKLSLELLMLANRHQRFSLRDLLRFTRGGLGARAASAFVSDRLPWVQRGGRQALGWLSRRLPRSGKSAPLPPRR